MRAVNGKNAWWFVAVALILTAHGAARPLDSLVDAVLRSGPGSQLPAHLSMVLGVGVLERTTPVKQAVMRDGDTVRTFNVSTANHEDVVLITYNEQSRASKVYLASPAGVLRKAVSYQAGAPAIERSLVDARDDFAHEIKFWTELAKAPGTPK